MKIYTRYLPNEAALQSLGENLSLLIKSPLHIYLSGPLGAGKTTLVRSYLRALGVQGAIKSPSYALFEPYSFSNFSVYHFDFYRFFDQNEWVDSGFRDYFEEPAICWVEWPERADGLLPHADVEISLSYQLDHSVLLDANFGGRHVEIRGHSPIGMVLVEHLIEQQ
jgi:tRNA threonylcarbamoyladenosine biosynthesis protein TsaE